MKAKGFCVLVCIMLVVSCPTFLVASLTDFDLTGDVRLRLRFTDSGYTGHLTSTYGEEVRRGFSLRNRTVFEISYPLDEDVTVGGLIRVSNEPSEVIRSGPDYLSSQFGSAFIAYETQTIAARFGYYRIAFSPLSLMRWDLKDDPEGGGGVCPVCAGPGVAGAILGETLEELGPELGFEGLKLSASPIQEIRIEGYFARPEIAGETYPVVTYGAKAGVKHYIKHASSFLEISLMALRSQDDHKTLKGDTEPLGRVFQNDVYGASWNLPLLRGINLEGEWMLTRSKGSHLDDPSNPGWDMEGRGGRFILTLSPVKRLLLDAAYIYISPNWDSYFRGLSYQRNRHGVRMRCEYAGERLAIALFAKFLSTIDHVPFGPQAKPSKLRYPTLSARLYYTLIPNLDLGLATIFSGEGTSDRSITTNVEYKRTTWLATLTYEMTKKSSISLEERYVQRKSDFEPDYSVSLTSLYVRTKLW